MNIKWPNDVVYQIFPDRWLNADPSNDPPKPPNPDALTDPRLHQNQFYGGDLAGISRSVPYLADLGVTAVYLTPIFKARSSHKYDTDDYLTVDPHFGTRAEFEEMVRILHAAGIKLVLDGVFNHTSFHHAWYRNLALRRKFYCMKNMRDTLTWMNGRSLPKLNPENPQAEKALLGVIDAWPEIDGWRLDAAHLLPVAFMKKLKRRVEQIRPANIVIMEDWTDSLGHFKDGICDGVTNFLFRDAVERFLVEDCSPETLLKRLAGWILRYPWPNVVQSWNLLDNHDTFRLRSRVGRNSDRMKIAFALQFTLPGTPMLYQGDEIGMTGKNDAEARAPMIWDRERWDHDLLSHVRMLIRLRRLHPVLAHGKWKPLGAANSARALAFERRSASGETAVVAINDGYAPFVFRSGRLREKIPPHAYILWISDRIVRGRLIRSWEKES